MKFKFKSAAHFSFHFKSSIVSSLQEEGFGLDKKEVVVAVKSILIHNERVLLLKKSDTSRFGAGIWEFPGGKINYNEMLEDAILREIKEETGLSVTIERLLYAANVTITPTRQAVIINYLCHSSQKKIQLSKEHQDFMWAGKAQMLAYLEPNIVANLQRNRIFETLAISHE